MKPLTIGSMCTGYGGLDMAVTDVLGGELVWVADNDPGASQILAYRYAGVPNLGDITAIDWANVPAVDIIAAGWPCQGISNLGHKRGLDDHRSGLWTCVAVATRILRPRIIVLENVAAVEKRGLARVASDLTQLGYWVRWVYLPASAVGAAHPRRRWICLATLDNQPAAQHIEYVGPTGTDVPLLPTPKASDGSNGGPNQRDASGRYYLPGIAVRLGSEWVAANGIDYGPAIRRWETAMERAAPSPTARNQRGDMRINPEWVEWLMGLPAGWVTDVPELDRNAQMRALGNGVVRQHAAHGLRFLMARARQEMVA